MYKMLLIWAEGHDMVAPKIRAILEIPEIIDMEVMMSEKPVQTFMRECAIFVNRSRRIVMAVMVLIVVLFATLPRASASTLDITYYTISSSDPDANHLSFGTVDNEVQNNLGPDGPYGLPVLNTPAFGCTSGCFSLASGPTNLTATGEITYWDPALNPYVTETGTGVVTLPFSVPSNFFPPNGTGSFDGGSNGYQAAVLSGNLIIPANTSETISFNIGADDMAFAYLGGQVVCDLGGVHGSSAGTCTTSTITTGTSPVTLPIDVFFVDINQVQAGLTFGIDTSGITTTPTPEPATLTLFGLGLAGVGFARRRKAN